MRYFLLLTIGLYQKVLSPLLKNTLGIGRSCRFSKTCSEYAKLSIQKYGAYKGLGLSLQRLIKCQPFYKEENT